MDADVQATAAVYDAVVDAYDGNYTDPKSCAEDRALFSQLMEGGYLKGRVLDIGCGTGYLLDHAPVHPQNYLGIDPSIGMLDHALVKHPKHVFVEATLVPAKSDWQERFNSAVCLFGSLNYEMDLPGAIYALKYSLEPGGRFFLVFYAKRHEKKSSYIVEDFGLSVARTLYSSRELMALFAPVFPDTQVCGFGSLVDYVPKNAPAWLFHVAMDVELGAVNQRFPDLCRYIIVTGSKSISRF